MSCPSFASSAFVHKGNRPVTLKCPLHTPLRRTRRISHTALQVSAVSTTFGRSSTRANEDPQDINAEASERTWRRQNSFLVHQARANGVDAAIEVLWRMTRDGKAVTQNYNQVISLLAAEDRFSDGLALADEAGKRGMANIITFRPLMKYCCTNGHGKSAKRVWNTMARHCIDGDMFLFAELMGALVRCEDLASAQKVLDSLVDTGRRPHIVLYNTLMKGFARKADIRRGFELFRAIENSSVKPDETTFNTLLNVCVRGKDLKAVNKVMALMHKYQVKPGVPTFNTLLKMFARVGRFEDALEIFKEMQETVEPSIVTYNTLIDGCAHRGDMDQAAKFFDEMVDRGFTPDICTMTSLLKGFGRCRDPEKAVELFEAMKEGGYQIQERTRYAVINACLRGKDRKSARKYIDEMKESGLTVRDRTWIWLLESDIQADDEQSALETLRGLYKSGGMLEPLAKVEMLREVRERGGLLRLQRELKACKTLSV
ncbi:hypothetical protein FGB62_166g036 [Gracilaria domingensis]|nr:hypothetical protein FGB62_166g036 [Gracilaria domingensis]